MNRISALILATSFLLISQISCQKPVQTTTIKVEGSDTGRIFEGIGGVSAGASSRLLQTTPNRSAARFWIISSNPTTARRFST